jgi:SUKH-3 immunity protein
MFRKEVQEQFIKAGWFEGRNIKPIFNKIKDFEKFPIFLRLFLYEYGDLKVETHKYNEDDVTAILNFKALKEGYFEIEEYLSHPAYYGGQLTFPIAYYDLDNAVLECDAEGKIYMAGDVPCLVAHDFKTGIEKVIMEDYNNTLQWNPDINQWVDEY